MFIDTHCHINFSEFDRDRGMVIGNAKKAGVKKFINPGVDAFSSKQAVELARKHTDVVFAAIGFHPYEAQHRSDINKIKDLLSSSASPIPHHPSPIVAIGECGLDYHQYKGEKAEGKKQNQRLLFQEHIALAIEHNLPLVIHCRDAWDDLFDVLDAEPTIPRGVLHCFSGGLQELRMARERGLFIGIDGNVTYSTMLQNVVPHIPREALMLETDAPYLTPLPHRGQRNEPKFLPLTAKKIAALMNVPVREIEETTTRNAHALFHLSPQT